MNIYSVLADAIRRYPAATALERGEVQISFSELDALTAAVAAYYDALGCRRGDRVLIFLANSVEYPLLLLGALRAGLVAVPVNAKLLPDEAAWICIDAEARVVIAHRGQVEQLRTGVPASQGTTIIALEDIDFASLPPSRIGPADVEADDLAWLFYTSGTTGKPKGAMLSHRNLIAASVNCLADMVDFGASDRVLHVAPLSHASGIYLIPALARGAANIIAPLKRFDPDAVVELVERERVSIIAFVAPTMIIRLLAAQSRVSLPRLRAVVYGGASIHLDHIRAAVQRFGPVFRQLYGQGEAPMTISGLSADAHIGADDTTLRSAGYVRAGVEVRIEDENGGPLAPGEEGEICVRGDVVMLGYWRNSEATARAIRSSWLLTGDIGRFDAEGRLHILDRKADTIISGGTNIYPKEIEDVIAAHPLVREVVAFGVPDDEWGQAVAVAAVAPGLDEGALRSFCEARMASFKRPKHIRILDALPQSAYGKVLRRELRDRVANPHPIMETGR